MPSVRPLVLCIALLGPALLAPAVLESAAWAQDAVFPAPGLVQMLPAGEVVGDGVTAVQLHVLALTPDGKPMTGLKPRVTSTEGTVSAWTDNGGGLYTMSFVPPKADVAKTVSIKLRGKMANGKDPLEADFGVAVHPPMSKHVTIVANPPQIVLGQDAEATLSFTLEGAPGQPLQGADLVVTASSGDVTNLTPMGGGKFSARYVAPKVNYPHLAIVTVADKRDPARTYGYVSIELDGKTDYPVKAAPNASVILKISGRDFGPVQAGADGRASVPVVVPPGTDKATLVSVVNGQSTTETIDLRIPETKRVRLLPGHAGIPSDASLKIPVRVVVRTPEGQPDTNAKVNFSVTAGTMSAPKHEGDGVYESDYTPPTGNSQMDATVTVSIAGSAVQTDTRTFTLYPVRPESLKLTAEPATLAADTSAFKVFAKVVGPEQRGLGQRELALNAAGAKLKGPVQDLHNGDYRADFSTTGSGPVELLATVQTPATGNPIRRVIVFPVKENIPNDGITSDMLTVLTVDEFGYPVPNVEVAMSLDHGDGSLPSTATTNANGIAQVFYTAGRKPDLVRITATAGDHTGSTAVLQTPPSVTPIDLPDSGSDETRALDQKWGAIVTPLRIEREGKLGAAAGIPDAVVVGNVSALTVKAEPSTIAPGGTVTLRIHAADSEGRGVAGQQLDFITSSGRFGSVTDNGGGDYTTTLTLPADATGEAKVSIASADGAASAFLKVPISASASTASSGGWGSTDTGGTQFTGGTTGTTSTGTTSTGTTSTGTTSTGTTASTGTTGSMTSGTSSSTTIPKPHPEATTGPALRVRAGYVFSSYHYEQRPLVHDGPLLPDRLVVGGQDGGANAAPQGFELAARGFLPTVKYLGFDAAFNSSYYAITTSAFGAAKAPDWLVNGKAEAIGRYPFQAGSGTYHVGVRAGFRYSDFIVFKGCLETGCTVEYSQLMLPGLGLGAEIGGEVGKAGFVAGIEKGLYGSTPYLTAVDVNVSYDVTDQLFGDLGFEADSRRIKVIGADSGKEYGELSDGDMMFKLSVGYKL